MVRVHRHQGSVLTEWRRVFSQKAGFLNDRALSNSFWRIAVVAAAGFIGSAPHVDAATSIFGPDYYYYDDGVARPRLARPHKARRHVSPKTESVARESAKPQGPLIIAISIERQSLRIYDANGLFAETPISTGMQGHPTPMGVFSVIQKQKFHRSNIYSGAPMPFMQRITWSGVAMHAGVLPGYPASHGCIRMPMNFAVKMWGWTRMGARVVITPGEMTPGSFSHPLLATQKPASTPVATAEPQKQPMPTARSDQAMVATGAIAPGTSEPAPVIKREQTLTADASGTLPLSAAPAIMSDAPASASGPASNDKAGTATITALMMTTEAKPAPADGAAKLVPPAAEIAKANQVVAEVPKLAEKFDDKARAASATVADLKKDQTTPADAEKGAAKPDPAVAPKRSGQIAVFISRKDSKLYVRQNFAPLFEVPVTIAASDRPLGTHVFTARADKDEPASFHWSVVTLPAARHTERRDDDERLSRLRKTVGAVEMKSAPVPDSPAEALDRITIPADAMAKITDALSTGGSIIVSDQGITAGETGEGTDFIVSLH
jgi:lipoprotein-anchoring transpeptidase ErfK/SrfK